MNATNCLQQIYQWPSSSLAKESVLQSTKEQLGAHCCPEDGYLVVRQFFPEMPAIWVVPQVPEVHPSITQDDLIAVRVYLWRTLVMDCLGLAQTTHACLPSHAASNTSASSSRHPHRAPPHWPLLNFPPLPLLLLNRFQPHLAHSHQRCHHCPLWRTQACTSWRGTPLRLQKRMSSLM